MKKKLSMIGLAIVLAMSLVMVVAAPASAACTSTGCMIVSPVSGGPAYVSTTTGGTVCVAVVLDDVAPAGGIDITIDGGTVADESFTDGDPGLNYYIVPVPAATAVGTYDLAVTVNETTPFTLTETDAVAVVAADANVNSVSILSPTVAVPAVTNTGGNVEVTAQVNVEVDGYYTVTMLVTPDLTNSANAVGMVSDLMYLTNGTTTITRLVSLSPGIAANTYLAVAVSVNGGVTPGSDLAIEGNGSTTYAALSIAIPGTTITTTLIGKSVMVIESVMDKFVQPGLFNTALVSGDANDALTSSGAQLVDSVSNIAMGGVDVAGEGVTMGGEILSAVHGAVVTKVPTIVNGALSLVSEIVSLFSSTAPLAP